MIFIMSVLITVLFVVCESALAYWSDHESGDGKILPCCLGVACMFIYIGLVLILCGGGITFQ